MQGRFRRVRVLYACLLNIRKIRSLMDQEEIEEVNKEMWDLVCSRLDSTALILFQLINLAFLCVWLTLSIFLS